MMNIIKKYKGIVRKIENQENRSKSPENPMKMSPKSPEIAFFGKYTGHEKY